MVLRAQTDLSDVSIHGTNGIHVSFVLIAFSGALVASKCLPQFTCIFLFTNVAHGMDPDLITLQLLNYVRNDARSVFV